VPPVHDLGATPGGDAYLAMKLIGGRTLADLLRGRAGPAEDLPRWVQVFEQVAPTVGYAHAQYLVHPGPKPHNVMVGAFGEVQVLDWGLAKQLARPEAPAVEDSPEECSDDPETLTRAGAVLGTPAYMAPEQARGEIERIDARTDVFGLGAILCEILTGR